jgi:acetyltransferase-like isoleucine patch superfamily enzyme
MRRLVRAANAASKLLPVFGLLANRLRFPGLHCGVGVEIDGEGLSFGDAAVVGAYSRLYLGPTGRLRLGDAAALGRDVHIETRGLVSIGARTGVNDGARINGSVSIGRGCAIGPGLNVSSGTHVFRSAEPWLPIAEQERRYPASDRPVRVGDDCWIGAHVAVMPGVTIGRGAVIGANAVVTRDVAPYAIAAGAPARAIGERMAFAPPAAIEATRPEDLPYFYSGFDQAGGRPQAYPCDREFVVALQGEGAEVELRILAEEAGEIAGHLDAKPFGIGETRLVFARETGPFQRFTVKGEGHLAAARLR